MINAVIFLVAMFLVYNYLILKLVDAYLTMPKLKTIYRIPIAIANTLLAIAFTMLTESTSYLAYILIGVVLFAEFIFLYKDKFACSLFCMLACVIHIMAMRSMCVAGVALVTHNSIYDVTNIPFLLAVSTGITFMLLDIVVYLVIMLIPANSIRMINQHNELLGFVIAWLSAFSLYLLINAKVYSTPNNHPDLLMNQISAPITILIGTYIVLFFSIKTGKLLGYKEKTEELQHTMEKDRQYRTTIDRNVFQIIEVDFNKNELISGFEEYKEQFGDAIHDYSKMLEFMLQTSVHPEDKEEFMKHLSPPMVVEEFEMGRAEISFDYRRLVSDGGYVWMRVLIVLVQDTQSRNIKGFIQIKNIDEEKRQQLDLQYKAERDLLTGLYNKGTTEMLISKRLASDKNNTLSGGLFIIDIDDFKTINDRLGHLYGDAVLSELSDNLRKIFREHDIVGRIGGDEFLVFAEGLHSESIMIKKAKSICRAFLRTYANEKNEDYTVSSSVGIAVFPKDGKTFEALFKYADAALYTRKAQGKNGYSFYNENLEMPYVSTRTAIDTHGVPQKSFKENRIEYVFRLLYGSEDTKSGIESVLELIAKNFGFSRANIFEFNELSTHFNGVFEWCAIGIPSVSANYTDMPLSEFGFVIKALEKSGGMFVAVPADFPEDARESYTSINIKSIVHFSFMERDKLIGVVAFQDCVSDNFSLSENEYGELRTICQVLSVFMVKQLTSERLLRHHQAIEAVMDNMNSIAYVIDRETYDVFYENQNVITVTGHSSIGAKCYYSYRGLDVPCGDCPLSHLSAENPRCTLELYTEKFDIYTKTSASLIDWSNDRKAMLISSVDVTEYKSQMDVQ